MNFSCARCGQRYSSVDEPMPGHNYRIPCVVCGGTVLLKGADFPALPTFAGDPGTASGAGDGIDATTEEPLVLALAPMSQQEPPALPTRRPSPMASPVPRRSRPVREGPTRNWLRVVAQGVVIIAVGGAGVLLLFDAPTPETLPAVSPVAAPEKTALPGGGMPDQESDPVAAARPVSPSAPLPPRALPATATLGTSPGEATVPPTRRAPSPPPPKPAPALPQKPPAVPAPRERPVPARPGVVGPTPPTALAGVADEGSIPASTRPTSVQMVVDAVSARRAALGACVQESLRQEPHLGAAGRHVDLLLTVNPSGIVTSPELDDPVLEDTALGGCLRNVVRRMVFPVFEGEPLQVRIPLTLGE